MTTPNEPKLAALIIICGAAVLTFDMVTYLRKPQ